MKFDGHLFYTIICAAAWFTCMVWLIMSIINFNIWGILLSIIMLFFAPVILEVILNIYGFLTSSSLRRQAHKHDCDEICDLKFPIVYSDTYKQTILGCQRKKHGIDNDLAYYIYRTLEEEEILDSKDEEELWYEDAARRIIQDDEKSSDANSSIEDENVMNIPGVDNKERSEREKRRKRNKDQARSINKEREQLDRQKYSPEEEKNFYHEPDSPTRAFLMDKLSFWYLLKMCYSWPLSKYLGVPAYFLPGWVIRFGVLIPQAQVAKGTVDGICLAIRHGWAINLDGGYTHAYSSSGSMFNVYPDITLAIHYAKKWHVQSARRILVINTSV